MPSRAVWGLGGGLPGLAGRPPQDRVGSTPYWV